MAKIQCKAQVVSVEIASQAAAGQFISLYCNSEDKL